MPSFTDLTGLAGVAVAISAAGMLVPGIIRFASSGRLISLAGIFMLMLIPFGGMPFSAYVRGISGDLSITTLVLLLCTLLRLGRGAEEVKTRHVLLALIALTALLLYPLALGFTSFDPYRLGFGDPWLVTTLLLIALAAWVWKHYLIASCIALAIMAWAGGWYESGNLWDYLLDPWLAIYALFSMTLQMARVLFKQVKNSER